jgi:hypothetical protein
MFLNAPTPLVCSYYIATQRPNEYLNLDCKQTDICYNVMIYLSGRNFSAVVYNPYETIWTWWH